MIEGFEFRDPDGTFLTLTAEEAPRFLAILNAADEEEPLSEFLLSMRDQLAEFVEASE